MIMRISSFENDIVFSENYISVLHIQNGTLFARIIIMQMNWQSGYMITALME